jgi:hypothetical protein
MPLRNWAPDAIKEKAIQRMEPRMTKACLLLQRNIKTLLNKRASKGQHSSPGQPPMKQSGHLYDTVFFKVVREGNEYVGMVYTNTVYARRLELGFVDTDSLGRKYDQKPRPFMRPGYAQSKEGIKKILGGK